MWPKSAIWLADLDHMTPNLHSPWPLTWQQWLCILFSKENVTLDLSPSMILAIQNSTKSNSHSGSIYCLMTPIPDEVWKHFEIIECETNTDENLHFQLYWKSLLTKKLHLFTVDANLRLRAGCCIEGWKLCNNGYLVDMVALDGSDRNSWSNILLNPVWLEDLTE